MSRSATQGIARRNGGRSILAGALLRRILLATGLLVVLAPAAQATICMRPGSFNLTHEGPWQRYMTVKQGGHCTVSLHAGGKSSFERVSVVQAPNHGAVRVGGIARYRYSAPKNYTGNDQFTVRACGHTGPVASCANFQFEVTIVARNG